METIPQKYFLQVTVLGREKGFSGSGTAFAKAQKRNSFCRVVYKLPFGCFVANCNAC